MGIDVVSCGEIYTACLAGYPMENAFFHGNNKTDAKNIGFDDSFIYDEFALPRQQRKLPSEVLLRDEAQEAFRLWSEKKDKVEY